MSKIRLLVLAVAVLPAGALAAAFVLVPGLYEDDLATTVRHREAAWTGSTTCRSCHPDHYASWDRTFHSTMTQEATPQSVAGAFDGREVTYWGVTARPVRRGDEYFIEYLRPSGEPFKTLQVRLTVGSRRYQQYVVEAPADEDGENLYRIPLLWSLREDRWLHLNGAFLGHDDEPYDNHTAIWNQNCIFCHNTGPQPGSVNFDEMIDRGRRGEPVNAEYDGRYVSRVAEHGISCESCHAPAGEHAARNRNPLRRYLLHLQGADDPTIVNPEKLPQERRVEVCGQCHGQRLPDPPTLIRDWLHAGPPYRAGETLTDTVQPVERDTPGPPHSPDMFARRFWNDGTPRLSAYEYQGITMSPCYQQGELVCGSCHTMHGGDIHGMIEASKRGNAACGSCHADLVADASSHTRHAADSSGSSCYACHMQRMVYGIQEIHRSHRIQNPDAASDAEAARPNACTSCHLDRSALWAAGKSREWWGGERTVVALERPTSPENPDARQTVERYRMPASRGDGAPLELTETVAALFAGDPVQRAVAARLAGRRDTPLAVEERAFLWPVLLQGLEDNYPTIRWLCRRSLLDLQEEMEVPGITAGLERYDYIAPAPRRAVVTAELRELWAAYPKDHLPSPPAGALVDERYQVRVAAIAPLLALKSDKMIHIGE